MSGRPVKQPETYFGFKLREFRKSLGLNQTQLAVIWGTDRAEVSRYELYLIPSRPLIKRLNEKFNIDAFNWIRQSGLPVSENQLQAA